MLEQVPNRRGDARAVVVDAKNLALVKLPHAVPGHVDLGYGRWRQSIEIGQPIPTMIAGADINIVDVAQNAASRAPRDLGEEFPFGEG